jgi:hypothetical protein
MRLTAALSGSIVVLLFGGVQVASAAEIEGVWSFNGGEIGVQATAPGQFQGMVVSPTRFAICDHPVGEQIWSDMKDNGDGSFTGLHQWYFNQTSDPATCRPTSRGSTTYRVIKPSVGSRFLRVCFRAPPELQSPPDGGEACVDSKLISELPPPTTATNSILSLNGRSCISRRRIRIHLRNPAHDPLASAKVVVQGRTVKARRGKAKWHADIDLRGRPRGAYAVRVTAVTVLGHTIKQKRTFRTCRPKKRV